MLAIMFAAVSPNKGCQRFPAQAEPARIKQQAIIAPIVKPFDKLRMCAPIIRKNAVEGPLALLLKIRSVDGVPAIAGMRLRKGRFCAAPPQT